jgi:hypothetical protein
MNILNILNDISKADPEVYDRLSPRRAVIRNFTRKVSLTALPFALGGLFKKAYGKTNDLIIDTLNLALTSEYLESEFYQTGINQITLIPLGDLADIQLLRDNETAHREFVRNTIISLGGTPIPKPTFDFTGGNGSGNGPFADVFTNYSTFLGVAQAFEENGVRAYKGQATNLMGNNDILEAALRIHSVEGRHVAHLRKMRTDRGFANLKPWITGTANALPAAAQAIYQGEDNTLQSNIQITGINGTTVSAAAASEAFDEPLTRQQVEAILDPFIA